jgi:hypothetical protein
LKPGGNAGQLGKATLMLKQRMVRVVFSFGLLTFVGAGVGFTGIQSAYAYCGGKCQAGKECAQMVAKKGVKGSARHDEYTKCMADPASYK